MKQELKLISGGPSPTSTRSATPAKPARHGRGYFQNLISTHFPYIEKQCYKCIQLHTPQESQLNIENEALELSNAVLDTLQKNDFQVLKDFKGNAQVTTYITTIISRHAVDMIRKKRGRNREKERAKKLGNLGLTLYNQVIKNKLPLEQVFKQLKKEHLFTGPLEELETLLQKIKGKNPHNPASSPPHTSGTAVKNGHAVDEEHVVIPDTKHNPQDLLLQSERQKTIHKILHDLISTLEGEDRLLLRMRFPTRENEKPRPVEQIAQILNIKPKAVYKRITKLVNKCKAQLTEQGVHLDEIL